MRATIGELIDQGIIVAHKDGNYGSFYPRTSDFGEAGTIFLTAKNVGDDGRIDFASAQRLSDDKADNFKFGWIKNDDVLLSHNATVGRVAVVSSLEERALVGTSLTYFTLDTNRILPRYFASFLRGSDFQAQLDAVMSYSTRNQVPITIQKQLSIDIPPLEQQKAIAHILGTLDDKIELNRKTNETLEAMAKALFKSWFVDFDPVKAKAEGRPTGLPAEISDLFPDSFEDSELGEIPSGWNVAELGDISTISGGKQLESVELKSKGRFPVYGANGTMGFHDLATHNSFVIVFGRVGAYCGSINWEYGGAWVNNNASSVIPLRYNELVLQWMLEADYSNYRTGSAQPFIPNGALACSPVLMPTDALASVFCDLLLPIRLKQKKNQSAALSLAEIRDALLPKLISGEIRIPDAEKMLEEVGI